MLHRRRAGRRHAPTTPKPRKVAVASGLLHNGGDGWSASMVGICGDVAGAEDGRDFAASCGASLRRRRGVSFFALVPRLRKIALFNLKLAFPDWSDGERREVVRGMIRQLGWMGGEFSQFPKYTAERIKEIVVLDGLENFLEAERGGKGVLVLTGHLARGSWLPLHRRGLDIR